VHSIVGPCFGSDGLCLLIEVELLLSDIVSPSLKTKVCGTNALYNSVEWKLRDKVEWSVNVEAEFLVQSLGFNLFLLVKVKDFPSLVSSIVSTMYLNFLTLNIFTLVNIKALVCVLDVAEMFS